MAQLTFLLTALAGVVAPTLVHGTGSAADQADPPTTVAAVLADSRASDWREPDANNTVYFELPEGLVIMELAPQFAPEMVANIRTLVREKFFDGAALVRAQDNYVVQWGDASGTRSLGSARRNVPAEFERSTRSLAFTALPDADIFADQVGFVDGLPAARDRAADRAWLVHCYAMVGATRGNEADSGNGSALYVIIGHSPRHLDRNITLVGRVIHGMELLSTAPRGRGELGFYQTPEERTPIRSARIGADVPENERMHLQLLRTDTKTFAQVVQLQRERRAAWFKSTAKRIDVCSVALNSRVRPVAH
jgi:peptidylprolyl isomerase